MKLLGVSLKKFLPLRPDLTKSSVAILKVIIFCLYEDKILFRYEIFLQGVTSLRKQVTYNKHLLASPRYKILASLSR